MDKRHANYQPWEKSFDRIVTPFEEFIHDETASGLILMACTLVALFLANGFLHHHYEHLLHTELALSLGGWEIRHTLHHWINDGLMALFFMVVGLEIKREVRIGELSDPKAAALPIVAAMGGMLVPAALFYAINAGEPGAIGWGVPMATDIAFAVGVLVLLGSRVPKTVLTFLVALAIVDDLGAVMVIAIFYTERIAADWLAMAVLIFLLLWALNFIGVRKPLPYFLVGIVMWFAMLQSGVHATLAGVLTALTIPVRPKFKHKLFVEHMQTLLDELRNNTITGKSRSEKDEEQCIIRDSRSRALLQTLENGVHSVESPLQRLEHSMHIPVAFLIMPLFALANAGIPIDVAGLGQALTHPVALGVMVGLVLGKLLGIAGLTWLALRLGLGTLPEGMNLRHLIGVGLVGGIGFTMSIFIAELGFVGQPENLLMAKTGVLFASLLAGVAGYLWLRFATDSN
ncbi:MAG: Na+/H+ antiporter NhaA [Gammaproteobacteria bacterium]|nr:Na+/H+ antiporter NhaA [Gammaproteobacteria bacterium]